MEDLPGKLDSLRVSFDRFEEGQGCLRGHLGDTLAPRSLYIAGRVRAGFSDRDDPISRAVQLALGLIGIDWASQYPGLLKKVNTEWRKRNGKIKIDRGVVLLLPPESGDWIEPFC